MRTTTSSIVAAARALLAEEPFDRVTLSDVAAKAKCGVARARNALESHGYEFSFNVAIRAGSGISNLPMPEWTIDWNNKESPNAK